MKRVLFLSISSELGGAERSLLNLLTTLNRAYPSMERHLLLLGNDGPLAEEAKRIGVKVRVLPLPRRILETGDSGLKGGRLVGLFSLAARLLITTPAMLLYLKRLRAAVREIQPSVIHSNGFKTHLLSRAVSSLGVPILWHMRDFVSSRTLVPRLMRLASGGTAATIAISESVAQDIRFVLPNVPVHRVYNGIDLDNFTPMTAATPVADLDALANTEPAAPGTLRIGIIAAYARWKGQDLFLQAAQKVRAQFKDAPVRFYVIGGPIYKTKGSQFTPEELRQLADQLGISADVAFIGFQKQTAPLYRALDVVVHASVQPEPFGLTIAEAMACGRPTIVSNAGGAAELFTHGHDALGFKPGDADDLAACMLKYLRNTHLRTSAMRNARITAEQRYNRMRVAVEILDLYKHVTTERAAARAPAGTNDRRSLRDRGADLRIAFINPIGEMGGGERNLLDIIAVIREELPAAAIHLVAFADGPFVKAAAKLGATTSVVTMPKGLAAIGDSALRTFGHSVAMFLAAMRLIPRSPEIRRFARALRTQLNDIEPTIVISNGIKCHLMARLANIRSCPIVWLVQDFFSSRPVVARLLRWAEPRTTASIAISKAVGQDLETIARTMKIQVIHSAIDTELFAPRPSNAPRPLDLDALSKLPPAPPETLRIGLIATYARWKGQDLFIDAAARIVEASPARPVRFYIIGGPIYVTAGSQFSMDELRAAIKSRGLEQHMGLVPFQQNIVSAYQSLDIMVHASTQPEPFGRTIVEAMSCGLPVIASADSGAAELFTSGRDAVGIHTATPDELAIAIDQLLSDDARRQALGHEARITALARFSRQRLRLEMLNLLQQTLERPSRS